LKKTIIIHPYDPSTEFLSNIHKNKTEWTILRRYENPRVLKDKLKNYDRIICMGHGTPYGLLSYDGYIITPQFSDILKQKETILIWCNADQFVKQYNLNGFYTGMIISEKIEADYMDVICSEQDITESNKLFSLGLKQFIDSDNLLEEMKNFYKSETNPVIRYNQNNLYKR